jgi:acetoacetyl-CoA synthetase
VRGERASWSAPALSVHARRASGTIPTARAITPPTSSASPDVWAHGDYGELTAHGGFVIHGRSDAVLNPGGVRIGTAEIYRQVERIPEVLEALVVGQDWQGDQRILLFVVLREGSSSTRRCSAAHPPQHPREHHAAPRAGEDRPGGGYPAHPISGKIVELAVRNVVHGEPVKNTDALANPEALAFRDRDLPELRD